MVRPFTDNEKAEIKQKMVVLAAELFKEQPFKEVKVSDITQKLGIAKGSFYNFFSSKESLLLAVLADIEKDFHQKILSLMSAEKDKKNFLIKIMQYYATECRNNELFKIIFNNEALQSLLKKIPEEQKVEMFKADEELLIKLVSNELQLKVPIEVAVDMLRAVFYLQSITNDLQCDIDTYNYHLISAVVNEIFE